MLRTIDLDLDPPPHRPTSGCGCGRPSRAEAETAVAILIRWAGDDPHREGLKDTPSRVAKAYEEWFAGYSADPAAILSRTFDEVGDYDDMVLLTDIPVISYCEHHMAAIRGVAHVAYLPGTRVVGISKLARLVEAFSRRLQIQERLTADIAGALEHSLRPLGVAVAIKATHDCMASRGVNRPGVAMVTKRLTGAFESGPLRADFLAAAGLG
ncbi:MAG: cyclohydrolase [Caulobacteraceae bacterium]|nr:cyclohydrolase [Caulobacteraceae bacterium]